MAIPRDDGSLLVHSSTQSPSAVQAAISRLLGLPMHRIEVDVSRIGGGFGGKESQASHWAALAALGAMLSERPVKLVLRRAEDLVMTGKRHPYQADFRIGLDEHGRILSYEVDFIQNAGAFTDLSLAVLERSLFHAGGSYRIPNLKATGWSCRTHLPPFTAMRGFGGPQAAFIIEAAIGRAAHETGIATERIQSLSLLEDGDRFPDGCLLRAQCTHFLRGFLSPDKVTVLVSKDRIAFSRSSGDAKADCARSNATMREPTSTAALGTRLTGDQRILLFGPPGVGKSTLALELAATLEDSGPGCQCIGADPGSPAFGVPGTVSLARCTGTGEYRQRTQ